jgi:hypothetical protein
MRREVIVDDKESIDQRLRFSLSSSRASINPVQLHLRKNTSKKQSMLYLSK